MGERESMVERVAAALWDSKYGLLPEAVWENAAEWSKNEQRVLAHIAIAAMREPTAAMVEASNREWDGRMSHRSSGAWQAMIDTALAEPRDAR